VHQDLGLDSSGHYNYFRDYDPTLGRYIQSDPIGLVAGLNTYGYSGQAPLAQTDRLGLMSNAACCSRSAALGQGGGDAGWVVCCQGRKVACALSNVTSNQRANQIFYGCAIQHEERHFPDMPPCRQCTVDPERVNTFNDNVSSDQAECSAHQVSLSCLMQGFGSCGSDNNCREQVRKLTSWSNGLTFRHCSRASR
jgi:RHS repeat-associated protein